MGIDFEWTDEPGMDPHTENTTMPLKVNGMRIPAVHASEEVCEQTDHATIRTLAERKIRQAASHLSQDPDRKIDWRQIGRILITNRDLS